ncbi:hypothetical protein ANCCAN_24014 [Ancylostoma caninum]|uniref:Uncharacterized protein n=1 Tax=Ancylostoma caninum TaxID=29170 RepID=A0A368FDG9_ANCCA|nr:hypothetical protein ANCCAN_24014 [Ancylostoma caninum]
MRSKDLREYFSDYVENGKFHCFHYRHRPEHQQESTAAGQKASATSSGKERSTSCCVISFTSSTVRSQFIQDFHGRHWVNSEGMEVPRRCFVSAVKVAKLPFLKTFHASYHVWVLREKLLRPCLSGLDVSSEGSLIRTCQITASDGLKVSIMLGRMAVCMSGSIAQSAEGSSDSVTDADLRQMIELRPPLVMPQGNVGTPTQYFLDQIKLCRLPASLIPKLGLKTLRRRRKYDSVPFQYSSREEEDGSRTEADVTVAEHGTSSVDQLRRNVTKTELLEREQSIREQAIPTDPTDKALLTDFGPDNDAGSDNDDDQCEEWERHEALHDDVTEQDRTKPRKYEEEMEIVWEKGGPGLVWYTDKNYWDEREKDSD